MDKNDSISTMKAHKSVLKRLNDYKHDVHVESLEEALVKALDVAEAELKKKKK